MTSLAVLLGEADALTEVLEPIQHRRFGNSGVLVGAFNLSETYNMINNQE